MANTNNSGELAADVVEDDVMTKLPTLDAAGLAAVCGVLELVVPEEQKEKKRDLLKLIMRHLCTSTDATEDKLTDFLQLHEHLFPKDERVETSEVKTEEVIASESMTEGRGNKGAARDMVVQQHTGQGGVTPRNSGGHHGTHVEVTKVRLKEFKLPGMVGGDGENALSFTSLQFEIEKGRKLGHSETEICSAVISKVADKEMRNYFETTPDMELDDVLEILKSICTEQESSAVFTQFTNDQQGENEK